MSLHTGVGGVLATSANMLDVCVQCGPENYFNCTWCKHKACTFDMCTKFSIIYSFKNHYQIIQLYRPDSLYIWKKYSLCCKCLCTGLGLNIIIIYRSWVVIHRSWVLFYCAEILDRVLFQILGRALFYYLLILGCYSQILSIILLCRDLGSSIISDLGSSIILLFTDLGLLFTDLEYYFIVQRYCTSHSKAKLQYNTHFTYSLNSF